MRSAQTGGSYRSSPADRPPGPFDQRRRRFGAGAGAMLRQAVADSFHDAARLRGESLFEPLRSDPGFRAILAGLGFPAEPFAQP
jgi:hypothetical protein